MNENGASALLDTLLRQARPEQRQAVTAGEPLVVVGAGAGTGKTKTLAWRFIWSLLAFPQTRVENILTLTFTEKAAREMKERIGRMIAEGLEAARTLGLQEAVLRLSDAGARLDEAYISTIHAFALRVIRENGLTLPVDPRAGIVSPPREEAFWESFTAALDSLVPEEASRGLDEPWKSRAESLFSSPALKSAVNAFGPEAVAEFCRSMTALHGSRGRLPEDLWNWNPGEDENVRLALLRERVPSWKERLDRFRTEIFPGLGDLSSERTALGRKLDTLARNWREGPVGDDPGRLLDFLEELDTALKSAGGKLKETLSDLLGQPPAELRKELENELPLARSLVNGLPEEEQVLRQALAQTAAVAWARWEQAKTDSGCFSFDDLIRHASSAVSANPAYGKRFHHLLVDEVQDTDPLQDALIGALWKAGGGRLFLVGDLKQSIYRFRHADPALFARRIREEAKKAAGRYVLLDRSYRMREDLLCFVNGCFGTLWGSGLGKDLGVAYEALRGPDDAPWWSERNDLETPPLCLLIEPHREDPGTGRREKKAQVRRRLADRLAAKLAALRGKPAWDKDLAARRPLSWRDMAVLVPGRTHYPALQEAFEAAGIPAVFQNSQGFFSRGEVFDLISLLKALADPSDRLALTGWLASPFSGIRKEDALQLADASGGEGRSVQERLRERFPGAWERFEAQRALALLAGPGAVLAGLLKEPPAFYAAPEADRPRMAANLSRAASLAREFSAARGPSLAACAESLGSALRRALPAEEPDFFSEDEDVVRVMTVHAAKGLEFPVVAVLGLDDAGRGNHRGTPLVPSVFLTGVLTSLPGEEGRKARSVLWHRALEEEALQEEWERLFYVACTRAQDVLLLCGTCRVEAESGISPPGEGTWLSILEKASPGILQGGVEDPQEAPPGRGHGSGGSALSPAAEEKALALPSDLPALASVPATGYALFSFCPRAWRLQVRQGLDLAMEKPGPGEPGGTDLGSLAHRVLAEWDFSLESLDRLLPERFEGPADRALLRLPPELRAAARKDPAREHLRVVLSRFLETRQGHALAEAHRRGALRREVPFCLHPEDGPALVGVIDALWEEDGIVRLADYKFAAPSPFLERLGKLQLAFYGAAAGRLFPGRKLDLSLIFLKADAVRVPLEDLPGPAEVEAQAKAMAQTAAAGPFSENRQSCRLCPWQTACGSGGGPLE